MTPISDSASPPAADGKKQFNVYLPPALIRRVKYRALDDQTSLSEFVERALEHYLSLETRDHGSETHQR